MELQNAIRNLETSSEEQMAINEEALSVNEEYQSTNEELLASKEELQSLNEELNALNSQLQETLDRQRTTADDLQNVLYSTDVATIFLDTRFNIRFFTPATKALFNVIPSDVGRPLTDLNSLAADDALLPRRPKGAWRAKRRSSGKFEGRAAYWFIRRIMPYRTTRREDRGRRHHFRGRHRTAAHRGCADRRQAAGGIGESSPSRAFSRRRATICDSRCRRSRCFRACWPRRSTGEKAQKLVGRIDEALGAMTGMLNTLLDINQIEVGAVKAEIVDISRQRAVRPSPRRTDLSRAGGGPRPARHALLLSASAAIRVCSSR